MSEDEDTDGVAGDGSESGGEAGDGATGDRGTGETGSAAEGSDEGERSGDGTADDAGDAESEIPPGERIEELEAELADREDRIADLEERLDDREDRIEDLESRLKRKQADFQNYKKRAERKREDIKERATEDLVERLLDVRDNLRRGLESDQNDAESLRDGVEMTLREFDRVLGEENVSEIAPEPGEEIDPSRHEVMMQVDADVPEDTVADLYAPGYEMADRVIRPAQVTVSTGNGGAADDAGSDDATADEADDESAAAGNGESAADAEDDARRATAGESENDED